MILVNEEKCTGCGSCAKDCFMSAIEIIEKKAKFKDTTCLECGHCVAVCSTEAICMTYANMWVQIHSEYKENPEATDRVFFGASNVMLFVDQSEVNAGIAASRVGLAAYTYGLGSVFSGFIARACQDSEVREFLELDENAHVPIVLVLGYNHIKCFRTVPRKNANVTWK